MLLISLPRANTIRVMMDLECPMLGEERKSLPTVKMTAFDRLC